MRPVNRNRGTTLIEAMITVTVLAILAVSLWLSPRPHVNATLEDRARAVSLLRSQLALLKSLPPDELVAQDGRAFEPGLRALAVLPEGEGRIRVVPDELPGMARVSLEVTWRYRTGLPQRLSLATLRRVGAPAGPAEEATP